MSDRLTTVATYDIPAKAEIAVNVLRDAGIRSVVTDSEIVAMDWLISNAVGGIKVQVREEDAERAAAVLHARFGPGAGLASEEVDEEELARQALAAGPAEPDEEPDDPDEPAPDPPAAAAEVPADEAPDGEREGYARRLFLAAVFSIIFPPLWFYAIYLLLNAAFGPGPLSDRGRTRLYVGAGLVLLPLLLWMLILASVGRPGDYLPTAE